MVNGLQKSLINYYQNFKRKNTVCESGVVSMIHNFEIQALKYLTPQQRQQLKDKLHQEANSENNSESKAIAKEYLKALFNE